MKIIFDFFGAVRNICIYIYICMYNFIHQLYPLMYIFLFMFSIDLIRLMENSIMFLSLYLTFIYRYLFFHLFIRIHSLYVHSCLIFNSIQIKF